MKELNSYSKDKNLSVQELLEWLAPLVVLLEDLRGIAPMKSKSLKAMCELLHKQGVSEHDKVLCESWCLFGDWTYKGARPIFSPSDVVLTGDTRQKTLDTMRTMSEYLLILRSEYRRKIRESYDDGCRVTAMEYTKKVDKTEEQNLIITQQRKIHELEEKIERLQQTDSRRIKTVSGATKDTTTGQQEADTKDDAGIKTPWQE